MQFLSHGQPPAGPNNASPASRPVERCIAADKYGQPSAKIMKKDDFAQTNVHDFLIREMQHASSRGPLFPSGSKENQSVLDMKKVCEKKNS